MNGKEIIERILSDEGINAQTLADRMGEKRAQAIYDILNEKTKKVSKTMANKIIAAFPQYSLDWLTTGEGVVYADSDCVAAQKALGKSTQDMLLKRIDKLIEIHERDTRNIERLIALLEERYSEGSNRQSISSI